MSNGGAFQLLTNDGKQDDMILANRFLFSRLNQIQQARANDPRYSDPTPTLSDVEKTHLLFVNAHFKPFVAVAHEYQITQAGGLQFPNKFNSLFLYMEISFMI